MNKQIIFCGGKEYETIFKEGDRVEAKGYCGILVLDSVDTYLTEMLDKLHWNTVSENYLKGRCRVNNGESYSDNEIKNV